MTNGTTPPPQGKESKLALYIASVIGIAFVVLILFKTSYSLESMANAEYARGVISFLIVLAFIVLGVLMIIAALFAGLTDDTKSDAAFRRAREIFMSIVGIVGTIVGFYYGAANNKESALEAEAKPIGQSLVVSISGGVKPYRVTIKTESKPYETSIEKGILDIPLCNSSIAPPSKGTYEIELKDAKDQKASLKAEADIGKICKSTLPATPVESTKSKQNPASAPSSISSAASSP